MSPGNIRGKWKQEKCGTLISAAIRNPLKMLKFPTILHMLRTGQNLQENICNRKIRKKAFVSRKNARESGIFC